MGVDINWDIDETWKTYSFKHHGSIYAFLNN